MALVIDPNYVDVDFRTFPQYVYGDIRPSENVMRDWLMSQPSYEDAIQLIESREWKQLAEFTQNNKSGMEWLVEWILNQGQEGSCFPAGTLITLADGSVKPIEEMKCLDQVITAENNVGEVRQTMVRPYIGQLINVRLHGNNLVRCTPEHPILTKRGYIRADRLKTDDWVAIPKVRPKVNEYVQTASHLPVKHRCINELRTRKFSAPLGRTLTEIQVQVIPDVIKLDAKFGKIVGLFLAEGNIDHQKIVWTFNKNEENTLVKELRELLSDSLGLESKVYYPAGKKNTTVKVSIYGTLWCRMFESLCSNGSGRKRLHADLASGPPEFLKAVFDGWMSGDGNFKQRTNTGVTISRYLAVQMFQIATTLGMLPSLRRSEPKVSHGVKSRQPRYDLCFGNAGHPNNYRRQQDGKHCWRKVRELKRENFKGNVYNFHVHGDESYVADGLGVHNCVGNAWTQGYQVKWNFLYGLKRAVRMSAISGYKLIGRSPMSGAMVPDALEAGRQVGLLPLNTEENIKRFGIDACMPATGFYTKFPAKHKETAKNFRIDQYYVIRTFEGLVTALLRGDPVIVGRAGHSILYLGILFINGKLFFIYVNSWGKWGMAMGNHAYGFGLDSEKYGRISANWAFAIRSVLTPDFMLAA